ncbi:MAG: hypothetical protein BWY57_00099 [Betaproteobacteria bacterium ADurb.Bin341]|nr:MAG: hypothetical protein BWY57_00099 [Betaproteobacteria bacterium ADurb.Bin341]
MKSSLFRKSLALASALLLFFLASITLAADVASDVEKILIDIRQDQPVPKLDYLKKAAPINADSAYYQGNYKGIEIAVEAHPNSNKVASILLKITGADQTRAILPAVSRAIGKPHHSSPKNSQYSWTWKKYRTGSLHYDAGERLTIVSLFYQ